jgi:hypothetical protein
VSREWTAGPEQPARSQSQARPQPRADQPRDRHGPGAVTSRGSYSSVPGPGLGRPSLSLIPSGRGPGTIGVPGSADHGRRTRRQNLGPELERPSSQPRVKRSHRAATVQSWMLAKGAPHSPGLHPGAARARAAYQARRTRGAEPGTKARTAVRLASSQARTVPDPRGRHPAKRSRAGCGRLHCKAGLGKLGAGGQGNHPGPRRDAQSGTGGTGPRYQEPSAGHVLTR